MGAQTSRNTMTRLKSTEQAIEQGYTPIGLPTYALAKDAFYDNKSPPKDEYEWALNEMKKMAPESARVYVVGMMITYGSPLNPAPVDFRPVQFYEKVEDSE